MSKLFLSGGKICILFKLDYYLSSSNGWMMVSFLLSWHISIGSMLSNTKDNLKLEDLRQPMKSYVDHLTAVSLLNQKWVVFFVGLFGVDEVTPSNSFKKTLLFVLFNKKKPDIFSTTLSLSLLTLCIGECEVVIPADSTWN